MAIKSDNLNLNLNLNLGASGGAGGGGATGYGRPRFNTEDMDKLLTTLPGTLTYPAKNYDANWDPELRAWAYVYEFMVMKDGAGNSVWGGKTPIMYFYDLLNSFKNLPVASPPYPGFAVPTKDATGTAIAPQVPCDGNELAKQVIGVINAALDRADRAMEILDQATGPGALNYWCGLLRIDPVQDRSTFSLMLVARKIGEYVAMGLKDMYRMRRPPQVHPYILPLIDAPDTPSFPSSHSLQAYLISGLLAASLKAGAGNQPVTKNALATLASRVARNREIAGVHYPMDSAAGAYVADQCVALVAANAKFTGLLALVNAELSDLP